MHGNAILRMAVGPRQCAGDQLPANTDATQATHDRVQLCQNPQTEFTLIRESLGVGRVNHIFRVQGHIFFLEEEEAARTFEEVGLGSLERLFPGFTEDSQGQATVSALQSGIGRTRSMGVARRAHLGAVIAA